MAERVINIRLIREGRPRRATLIFFDRLPHDFWEEIGFPFLKGEKTFGRAKTNLTVAVIKTREVKKP